MILSVVVGMLVVFASVLAGLARRHMSRFIARRLTRRSLVWRVRVQDGLRLSAWRGRVRLRLYGLQRFDDAAVTRRAQEILRAGLDGRRVRLRILDRDADGTLVVTVRCDGGNPTLALLRTGWVATPATAARAYRQALIDARALGRGNWRTVDKWPPGFLGWSVERTGDFKYHYG
jgi:hypothetical protein